MIRHVHRKSQRTAKETARLRADRDRYQRDKPSPDQLLAEGGHKEFVPLGQLIFIHQVMGSLKKERERQGLTLADVSKRSGIDQAALSKLETGSHANPTLETLYRVALALGKLIVCALQDAPAEPRGNRKLARAR
jgi:DNA-binding XRE family transcriptional regulator